jgi:uncharacterized cupin superfamily protein
MHRHQPRHENVVNSSDAQSVEFGKGKFQIAARRLSAAAGGKSLGCALLELEPGKTAFPFHFHSALEEAIYVLEGTGSLRIHTDEVEVRAGDYIAMPAGPEHAHALTNTSAALLRYLCISGPSSPATLDIIVYPDSNKVAFAAGIEPGKPPLKDRAWAFGMIHTEQANAGYYEGEALANE